jgi:hypothetical protein
MATLVSQLQQQVDWLLQPVDTDTQRQYYSKVITLRAQARFQNRNS